MRERPSRRYTETAARMTGHVCADDAARRFGKGTTPASVQAMHATGRPHGAWVWGQLWIAEKSLAALERQRRTKART
jgi:hypothetical protein